MREDIDAFSKFRFESQFQQISSGGAISYIKLRAIGVGMRNALDKLCYLVKPDIAERYCGITVV